MEELERVTPGNGMVTTGTAGGVAPQAGNLGDIQINLLDIELLTIRLRLIVASVDTARRMGINWWESDPRLSAGADSGDDNRTLRARVAELERRLGDE